jgi:tungstate transport system substrate-binding protein
MNLKKKSTALAASLTLLLLITTAPSLAADKSLMMATTTSTDDTGLLDYLAPLFAKDSGIELKWTATGTGKALKLGENCDVDVLLVHAPGAEKKFVADGFGLNRKEIMFNDFVMVGPESDPAKIKGKGVGPALKAIRSQKAVFVSRGDKSGTHQMELDLWRQAGDRVPEKETWYVQTGQGMLSTIHVAAERKGYTLTDRGTYIKYEHDMGGNPPLKIVVEGDDLLKNQYSVIAVNTQHCPTAQYDLAMQFSNWMAGAQGQKLIKEFTLMDKQLFTPNAK